MKLQYVLWILLLLVLCGGFCVLSYRRRVLLHEYARLGRIKDVERLAARGLDLNRPWIFGVRPLHSAVMGKHADAVAALLRLGADPDLVDGQGLTPLHHALMDMAEFRLEVVQALVAGGADVNRPTPQAHAPLMLAALHGHPEAAFLLLERGADPSHAGDRGVTALMVAALRDYGELVRALLERGVPVDHRDTHGRTALTWAAGRGCQDAADLLLAAGADPSLRDAEGKSAAELAREHGHAELAALLERAGGR